MANQMLEAPSVGTAGYSKVYLQECRFGRGVFAAQPIAAGEEIGECSGPRIPRAHIPHPYSSEYDYYLQIGPDLYLGPSGQFDDFVNHSCSPNAGLKFSGEHIMLVAIADIAVGEHITFDYSTTMFHDEWEMICACGAPNCRGLIKNFATLAPADQERYIALGVVPDYVIQGRLNGFHKP